MWGRAVVVTRRIVVPLAAARDVGTTNEGTATELMPVDPEVPLPLFDPRCKTLILHNGA